MTADHLIQTIEGLLEVNVKYAERVGLDNIPMFTVARAKTLLADIKTYKDSNKKVIKKFSYESKLDKRFELSM